MLSFLAEFLRSPRAIGSVVPSSPSLGRILADAIADVTPGVIVELGAGTGPVTRQLATRFPDAHLIALEPNPRLAERGSDDLPR